MRPQYSNAFYLSKNSNGSEILITFIQQYAERDKDQLIPKAEDIANIVLTPDTALELRDVLTKVLDVEYPPTK